MISNSINPGGHRSEHQASHLRSVARDRRIRGTRLNYVEHATFNDPNERDAILGRSTDTGDVLALGPFKHPDVFADRPTEHSEATSLTREQEAHLFRKMNYLKYCADRLKRRLDPDWPNLSDLDEIDRLQSEALAIKHRLVEMNLPLVVFVARTRVRVGYDLSECVSDGSLGLIIAVDSFDFSKGYRFSTYAVRVIRNTLEEHARRSLLRRGRSLGLHNELTAPPVPGLEEVELGELKKHHRSAVRRWLVRLNERERRILAHRYGIGGAPEQTLAQIGRELGISKEYVRRIALRAQAKLREFARREAVEI